MPSLSAFSPVLIWFLAGIVFLALELVLPGLVVFFFGVGAWCAALAVALYPVPLAGQFMVFLAASILSLVLLRSTIKKVFLGRTLDTDAMQGDVLPKATGEVIEDIQPPAPGTVKYGGSFWKATADVPLVKGTVVRIMEKSNLTVKVSPVTPEGDV
ncbi:MAG: NfeD family protein [Desulfobulbus sp.]|jgi:membrane protein implicated in regulation of membrane protease activity|uniref:NfeD family protein n=1 Tax=Desulfobulbus sp. TaxID=895 RepID=UPI0028491BE7|nr:NfeD family protein [Desulfobulbus sp.]MDR2551248.1 NfeD family protein [Desulfobulbus sp.]